MLQFCSLRLYLSIETISCRLSQRMARMDMDGNLKKSAKKLGQLFQVLRLLLPDEVCLTSSIFIELKEHFLCWQRYY